MDIWQWILTTTLYLGSVHGLGNFRLPEDRESNFTTDFFEQKIDHFSFALNKTFKQRYHIRDQFWKSGGPIIYYIGSESSLDSPRAGFTLEVAELFDGLLVDVEHRFYGESQPFEPLGPQTQRNIHQYGYLTSWQALADHANLINHIKSSNPGAEKSAVIVFGGSYGGMLSAWMRVKYPHLVDGAISSSAPLLQNKVESATIDEVIAHSCWKNTPVSQYQGWPWPLQMCLEIVWTRNEGRVMSYPCNGTDFSQYSEFCLQTFNATPNSDSARIMYGEDNFYSASNIIFSNGEYDGWAQWGIKKSINPSVVAVTIPGGYHCADLRHTDETNKDVHNIERLLIEKWIDEANFKRID